MADQDSVRQRIIASVFSRQSANGAPEDAYIGHIKIREDDGSGMKARYILLSQTSTGAGVIHKSKLNTNGSFSVGKTWRLPELRAIEVTSSTAFNITLARTYRWQTENSTDQTNFLIALVRLFRVVTGGTAALQLVGFDDPDAASSGRTPIQSDYLHSFRNGSIGNGLPTSPKRVPANIIPRSFTPQGDNDLDPYSPGGPPAARNQSRTGQSPRPASPANSNRSISASLNRPGALTPTRNRQPSPTRSQTSSVRPRQGRRPSTTDSTSSQIPEINVPQGLSRPSISTPTIHTVRETNQNLSENRPSLDVSFSSISPQSMYSRTPVPLQPAPVTRNERAASPASSSRSRKQSSQGPTPVPSETLQVRREHNARVSFFDPSNQASLDLLISSEPDAENGDGEEETAQATMTSVEEMLEGYEWASDDIVGRKASRGTADLIEARLLDELMALEKANIHSFLESDDRINIVIKYLDEAIGQLDNMDSLVSSYKIHLNAVGDDISYIQSQNRGLQVQTQNQQALLKELQNLLQTVQVDREALMTLTQESLEKATSIQRLEDAATELYKALQAGRDTDMAATMERLDEYRTHNAQFCKRIFDFLSIMVVAQSRMIMDDNNGLTKPGSKGRPFIINHLDMEQYLGRYAGLMLYLKDMDEGMYAKLCAAYFSAASELHGTQIRALLSSYIGLVKKASDEDTVQNFGATPTNSTYKAAGSIRRTGTTIRSPIESRRDKGRDKVDDGALRASEAFGLVLGYIIPQIYREDDFLADFLQINDAGLTFADYAGLDNYFRRQAARSAGLSQSTIKLIRSAMDLIFGFLSGELKAWLDSALSMDNGQIIGIIACLERFLVDANETGNAFLLNLLEKQRMRLKGLFDRHVNDQIKGVEQTKLTSKKRKGVAPFIKYFPIYVGKVEIQLIGADSLEIRASVDESYEKIVQSMFDSLKQMANMDSEGEDKGQLNYHVILIENMHYFVAEIAQIEVGSVSAFVRQAQAIYDDSLNAYVKIVLRRPFAKIIDYFDGVERLLKTTAPTEVSSNSSYNKSALKKVIKEFNTKDVRKHVDALFKRVEKHFTDALEKTEESSLVPGTVMVGAWKACEEELLRYTEGFSRRITQCYAESGMTLDYTTADVEVAFRRHRVGS